MRCFGGKPFLVAVLLEFAVLSLAMGLFAQSVGQLPAVSAPTSSQNLASNPLAGGSSSVQTAPGSHSLPYVISPHDLLDISVYEVPELSQKVRVDLQGNVDLPLVNYVHLAGLTIDDAQLTLQDALKSGNFMTHPHVEISILEYGSGAEVMGEVARPGIYPVPGSRPLLDLLIAAGGTTGNAGRTVLITHKDSPGAHQIVQLSSDPKKAMDANVDVFQGDTVLVTKAGIVYVVGEVIAPSGFVLDDRSDYTAVKILAMAHGPTKLAKLSQARLVRRTPEGLTEIPIALDKIIAAKTPDVKVQADDILFVPLSKGKSVEYQSLNAIVSFTTSIGVLAATHGLY
jgi:polysaccharide export outer membrane protein